MSDHFVTLEALNENEADAELLGNLMELYVHDLSAIFLQVELGPNGRFGYPHLDSYLARAEGKRAFVMRCEGRVAGFALVKRGSPASDDPNVQDVAEFFVLRRFRARGVGRVAAERLWSDLPGSWIVRASAKNPAAVAFWRRVVSGYTRGAALESVRRIGSDDWTVFTFDSRELKD
jgi:predicted acetyltransferase